MVRGVRCWGGGGGGGGDSWLLFWNPLYTLHRAAKNFQNLSQFDLICPNCWVVDIFNNWPQSGPPVKGVQGPQQGGWGGGGVHRGVQKRGCHAGCTWAVGEERMFFTFTNNCMWRKFWRFMLEFNEFNGNSNHLQYPPTPLSRFLFLKNGFHWLT